MSKQSTEGVKKSSVVWKNFEEWVRGKIRGSLQDLLEYEVTVFSGREKSERRARVNVASRYRNGYGRKLTMNCGTVELQRPRKRWVEERYESLLLPLFVRRTETVADLLPPYICVEYRWGILSLHYADY